MKRLNFSLLTSICALLLGVMLVFWSQSVVQYLIMAVGFLFLIPGLYALFSYFFSRRGEDVKPVFGWTQIVGIGSILFGFSLVLYPVFFETTLMYALGVILAYAGLNEIITLVAARRWAKVSFGYYVVPVLVMLLGIFVLFNPIGTANLPFILLGVGCIAYGITGLVDVIRFRKPQDEGIEPIMPEVTDKPAAEGATSTTVSSEEVTVIVSTPSDNKE